MTFEEMLDIAIEKGKQSTILQKKCQRGGGHYRDKQITINGKPGFKCRCGFLFTNKKEI